VGDQGETGPDGLAVLESGGRIAKVQEDVAVGKVHQTKEAQILVDTNGIFFGEELLLPSRSLLLLFRRGGGVDCCCRRHVFDRRWLGHRRRLVC